MERGGEKRGFAEEQLIRLSGCIDRGLGAVEAEQTTIREQVKEIWEVAATLDHGTGSQADWMWGFEELADRLSSAADASCRVMTRLMIAFMPGLFVGEGEHQEIQENLDLERWFRPPKGHERRIHGRREAGVRLVQVGATLVHALDAHVTHPGAFRAVDLLAYRAARGPPWQTEALARRKVMRKARSTKQRPILMADLERRYRESPTF